MVEVGDDRRPSLLRLSNPEVYALMIKLNGP